MRITIADYGPGHIIGTRAEAEVYAAQYKPGTKLYVPYPGKTPRFFAIGARSLTLVRVWIQEDTQEPGVGTIMAEGE